MNLPVSEQPTQYHCDVLRAICNEHSQHRQAVRTYIICVAMNANRAELQERVMLAITELKRMGLITMAGAGRVLPTQAGKECAMRAPVRPKKPKPVVTGPSQPVVAPPPAPVVAPPPAPVVAPPMPAQHCMHEVSLPAELHPDTIALVVRFAEAVGEKLRAAEKKYGHGADWRRDCWRDVCIEALHEHVAKGDPRDVAAYCAFCWHHGWPTYDPSLMHLTGGETFTRREPGTAPDQSLTPDLLNRCAALALLALTLLEHEPPGDQRTAEMIWLHDTGLLLSAAEQQLGGVS